MSEKITSRSIARLGCLAAALAFGGCTEKEDPTIFSPNVDTSKAVQDTDVAASVNGYDDGTGNIRAKAPARKKP